MGPRLGPLALALMHHFESCRLESYRCPAGVWTIGWGETGPNIGPGLKWTKAQADVSFARRVNDEFAAGVADALGGAPASPAQFGAMVALAYNIGLAAFRRSSVLRLHKAGQHTAAADAFLAWCKSRGKILPGLLRRRKAERALYLRDFDELARLTNGDVQA